jgi:hypothetical protein
MAPHSLGDVPSFATKVFENWCDEKEMPLETQYGG